MHAHGVDVFDAADDHAVVLLVANDLELVLLPTDQRPVDLNLPDHAGAQPAGDQLLELGPVVGDAAAPAAQRERRPDDRGQPDDLQERVRLLLRLDRAALGGLEVDPGAHLAEQLAVLGPVDDRPVRPDHLDPVLLEHALVPQLAGAVQGGLPAEGREHRVDGRAQ